jgi:hypothetical protein
MKIRLTCAIIAIAVAPGAKPILAADSAQLRPLLVQGDWEVMGRYTVADKGIKLDDRNNDSKEWVRIKRDAIEVFRHGQEKPTELFDIKVVRLADQGEGAIEMSDKNNALKMTLLYRFTGNRLLLCASRDFEGKPPGFAAKGTMILELIPYQHNRLIQSCRRPEPKPDKVFKVVAPQMPPNPPPVADPKK